MPLVKIQYGALAGVWTLWCMPINYSMCLNCLLLASARAYILSRVLSVSMDAPMKRYLMLSEPLADARMKYHTGVKCQQQHSGKKRKIG